LLYRDLARTGEPAAMAILTDREVAELIHEILTRDSRVDAGEIDVRVEDGVVFLSGAVDSAAERRAAQEDVESTPAHEIVNTLTLGNFIERTDDELRAAVKQALSRDLAVDAAAVVVDAKDGVVTLSGRVASSSQQYAAQDVAWWTPGVTDVISQLHVDGAIEPPDEPDY